MTNELIDPHMITKKTTKTSITFEIKSTIHAIWMNQETIATFFDVPKKKIIICLAKIFDQNHIDKSLHCRKVSYVKKSTSMQETQYNFTIISSLAYELNSKPAIAFRLWIIKNMERYIKWGTLIDTNRIKRNIKQKNYLQKLIKKLINTNVIDE